MKKENEAQGKYIRFSFLHENEKLCRLPNLEEGNLSSSDFFFLHYLGENKEKLQQGTYSLENVASVLNCDIWKLINQFSKLEKQGFLKVDMKIDVTLNNLTEADERSHFIIIAGKDEENLESVTAEERG